MRAKELLAKLTIHTTPSERMGTNVRHHPRQMELLEKREVPPLPMGLSPHRQSRHLTLEGKMPLTKQENSPDFTVITDADTPWTLSDHRGQWVVIYFYPKDDTPGCTTEGCGFRDHHPDFQKLQAQIIGISRDSVESHKKFKDQYQFPFPLGSDADGKICEAYGVWTEKSMYGKKYFGIERSTFLIDPEGKIHDIWRGVKVPGHVEEVLKALKG